MANIGAVTTLAGKGDCILSDSLNHASIIDACRLSGAKITVYGHNDMDDLEKKCKKSKGRIFIVTEGTFSMDGDLSDAHRICEIADKYAAISILDDAHGDFALGKKGMGSWENSKRKPEALRISLSTSKCHAISYVLSVVCTTLIFVQIKRLLALEYSHHGMRCNMRWQCWMCISSS